VTLDLDRWQALSPLLDRALELEDGERTAWLAKCWEANPDLAAEVQSLLEERAAVEREGFLAHSPLSAFAPQPSLAGQVLGAYTLEAQLGQGGMGSVWRARRNDGRFEGTVAVKLLNAALMGRAGEERFRREGRILAKLTHPNIARLIDAGIAPGGQPYLVLEYIEGQPVDRYCERARFGVVDRLRLFVNVLEAVAHAHANLVVHRDIKPSNVLVAEGGVVKLLDFGIAKLLDDEAARGDTTQLTREAGRALTPDFAAPEQLLGEPVTTATDVYSLGVLLYLLLSGRHPAGDRTHSPAELVNAILEGNPPRIPNIATDLNHIVGKALKKDPSERYRSVTAFADDICRFLARRPVSARGDSLGYRAAKFVRRNRLAVALSALAFVALIGGLAGTFMQGQRATRQAAIAERERDEARYQARRAEASSEVMSLMLEELGPGGKPLSLDALIDRGVALIERRYTADPHLSGLMLVQMARRYKDIDLTTKERDTLADAIALARQHGDAEVLASALCALAPTEVFNGKPEDASRDLSEARNALARVASPSLQARVDCLRAESALRMHEGAFDDALRPLDAAKALLAQAGDDRTLMYTGVLNDLGYVHFRAGRWRESLDDNARLMDAFERNGRGNTVGYAILVGNRATTLYNLGEVKASLAQAKLARERVSAFPDLDTSTYIYHEGRALARLRDDDAIDVLRKAADASAKHESLAWESRARMELAQALANVRRFAEANEESDRAESFLSRDRNVNAGSLLQVALIRADVALAQEQNDEAQKFVDQARAYLEKPAANTPFYLIRLGRAASRVALAKGDAAAAEKSASELLHIAESVARDAASSADVGEALLLRAQARIGLGDREGARSLLERAAVSLSKGLGADHPMTQSAYRLLRDDVAAGIR